MDLMTEAPNSISTINVIKRNGQLAPFDSANIVEAVKLCCLDVMNGQIGDSHYELAESVAKDVLRSIQKNSTGTTNVESIQDGVELSLMRRGEHAIARSYVLFREERAQKRLQAPKEKPPTLHIIDEDGVRQAFNLKEVSKSLSAELKGLSDVDVKAIMTRAQKEIFDGASSRDVRKSILMAARSFIEQEPQYDLAVARLTMTDIYVEAFGAEARPINERTKIVRESFESQLKLGVQAGLLDSALLEFDLNRLAQEIDLGRDSGFESMGVQTLYDRYLIHSNKRRIEVPQTMWMRVAMGLSIQEIDREASAIEFYNALSKFEFISSTPTLFNAGTCRPQLSSCFLTTVPDDLIGIYDAIKENAILQKFAGGLGNDWTNVRSMGAHIKGTNGESQGVIPFLKVVNDTAVAVNQGGKRKGAVCAYMESWHMDIEEFLELRKNTGDDRRRTHDMNSANWIPDLFMKRVHEDGVWTLFSPSDVPDLHHIYGQEFATRYAYYEDQAAQGRIKIFKTIEAKKLWRKMLTMLFETGHPWITFKDPCNIRSPQQHAGVVHSSNLCTEITLNTSDKETAVCNIGSVNLMAHMTTSSKSSGTVTLNTTKLKSTVRTAMRMLDNVIDINYYGSQKARYSNLRHRPVGIGMMGFHDALIAQGIPYASEEAVQFSDTSMEALAYFAYEASSDLAVQRGAYASFKGSLWSQGIMPHQTIAALRRAREGYLECDESTTMDWKALSEKIVKQGMRNSNCVAIAPTATIANIIGVSETTSPYLENLFVKSTLSGEFTKCNVALVNRLKGLGLWDAVMISDIKHYDGSLQKITRIPQDLRDLFRTAFEIDATWLIECASRRQKWIDQAQSLNLYMAEPSGKKLDEMYKLAWIRGLKTTYYLRTRSASNAEKSTGRTGSHNAVSSAGAPTAQQAPIAAPEQEQGAFCTMRPGDQGFESCEACQ
jgi:ribonucleoside-diphosphate reductase alpha chain